MNQKIEFGREGREKLLEGVKILASAVKSTLGPGGRNCIFNVGSDTQVTKDGVTVASKVKINDPVASMGADLIREAARKTAFAVGDGTTSSTVLTEAIVEEGFKLLASGLNAISVQRGIMTAAKNITEYVAKNIKEDCDAKSIRQVALVSTNWDEEIANLIAEAIVKVGKNGSVTVDNSRTIDSYVTYMDGMQIDRGYMSNYFVNDEAKQECVLEKPLILLSQNKITNNIMLKPILETAFKAGEGKRPILIIAPDVEAEALQTLIVNKLRGVLNICAIKCPGFGDRQKEYMTDLNVLLGGTYFTPMLGREFNDIIAADYASCEKVIITKETTTFIRGAGDQNKKAEYINYLSGQLATTGESWKSRLLKERIAKLSEGVAVIYVGATTDSELKERQDRVDDAVCACRAAFDGGIVPGGGTTLAKLSLHKFKYHTDDPSFLAGTELVRKALTVPLRQLLENAGVENKDIIINKIIKKRSSNFGYDIKKEEYVKDMVKAGIIDPYFVLQASIENAASVAGLILTTECIISEEKEPDPVP